jgi:hypothetical protein
VRISKTVCTAISLALIACGGGGGGGKGVTNTNSGGSSGGSSSTPTILSFSVDKVGVFSGQTASLSWTTDLTATCTAGGGWSGSKSWSGNEQVGPLTRSTTFQITCSKPNSTPASGAITVAVSGEPAPAPTADRVWSGSNLSWLDYYRLPMSVRTMEWSQPQSRLYALTNSDSMEFPNALVEIDPASRSTRTLSFTEQPAYIGVTHEGEYVYVGFERSRRIQRIRTSDLALDLDFEVGTQSSMVSQIAPSPSSPHTIAVRVNSLGASLNFFDGIVVVDDSTARSNVFYGADGFQLSPARGQEVFGISDLHWTDETHLMAIGDSYAPGIFTFGIDSQGINFETYRNWLTASPGTLVGDRFFSSDSRIFSLSGSVELAGKSADYDNTLASKVPSPGSGKLFAVAPHLLPGNLEDGIEIRALDIDRFTPIDTIAFNGAAMIQRGGLVLWGTDGFAINSTTELIIAHGSFAASGSVPAPNANALPVVATGTAKQAEGSNSTLAYDVIDIGARAAATNPCGRLYVATSSASAVRPGSVLEVDKDSLAIVRSQFAGSEPYLLAGSDDCSMLYVGLEYSTSVAKMRTEDLSLADVLPLGGELRKVQQFSHARSIAVAPGMADTVAIATGDIGSSLCSGTDQGVIVFDGKIPRPVWRSESDFGIKSIAFGANPNVLYGEDWNSVYSFDVGAGGLSNPRALMPYRLVTSNYDIGRDLYFDRASSRVYDLYGHVFDTTKNVELTGLKLIDGALTLLGCGTPIQARVADPLTGKLFWAGPGPGNGLSITAYSREGLANVAHFIILPTDQLSSFGNAVDLVHLPGNKLALVTDRGFLIVMQSSLLAP